MSYWVRKANLITVWKGIEDVENWLDIKIPTTNQRKTKVTVTINDIALIAELWSEDIELYNRLSK